MVWESSFTEILNQWNIGELATLEFAEEGKGIYLILYVCNYNYMGEDAES